MEDSYEDKFNEIMTKIKYPSKLLLYLDELDRKEEMYEIEKSIREILTKHNTPLGDILDTHHWVEYEKYCRGPYQEYVSSIINSFSKDPMYYLEKASTSLMVAVTDLLLCYYYGIDVVEDKSKLEQYIKENKVKCIETYNLPLMFKIAVKVSKGDKSLLKRIIDNGRVTIDDCSITVNSKLSGYSPISWEQYKQIAKCLDNSGVLTGYYWQPAVRDMCEYFKDEEFAIHYLLSTNSAPRGLTGATGAVGVTGASSYYGYTGHTGAVGVTQ